MSSSFHSGEQAVQAIVGVRAEADRLSHLLGSVMKPAHKSGFTRHTQAYYLSILNVVTRCNWLKARILWDSEHLPDFPGAQRLVASEISQTIATTNAIPLRWHFAEYSPYNPI